MVSPAGSRRSAVTPTGNRQNTAWDNRGSGQGRMVSGDMVAAPATIIGCAAEVRESPILNHCSPWNLHLRRQPGRRPVTSQSGGGGGVPARDLAQVLPCLA